MKLHDFCLTFPYGVLLIIGGMVGYLLKGSLMSFLIGLTCGLLLMFMGKLSMDNFVLISDLGEKAKEKIEFPTIYTLFVELLISCGLTVVMTDRYLDSGKFMPAGLVAGISGTMATFYVYKMLTCREHPVHSKAE